MPPQIKQLAHLCLKTSRLEQMTTFYRDQLGATLKFRYLNKEGKAIGCYFAFGNTTFFTVTTVVLETVIGVAMKEM